MYLLYYCNVVYSHWVDTKLLCTWRLKARLTVFSTILADYGWRFVAKFNNIYLYSTLCILYAISTLNIYMQVHVQAYSTINTYMIYLFNFNYVYSYATQTFAY